MRWRMFVSAFESVRAVHSPQNGEPSQVVLTSNVQTDPVVFATATPELANSWAAALQAAITAVTPLVTGRLFYRDAGAKSKTWHDWYWELRGNALVYVAPSLRLFLMRSELLCLVLIIQNIARCPCRLIFMCLGHPSHLFFKASSFLY